MHYNSSMDLKTIFFITLPLLWSAPLAAKIELKLMTFNTMCEFCHKKDADVFDNRKMLIKDIIKKSDADIISLQEVIRSSQLEYFVDTDKYNLHYYQNALVSYPDAALAIKKKDFLILDKGHFWLGENTTNFNFGWKWAMPRILLWMKVQHIQTKRVFTIYGSHFDNRLENLAGSSKLIRRIAKESENMIFLADTNSTYEMQSYQTMQEALIDLAIDFEGGREYCYLKKGKKFPDCRVDHIMTNIKDVKTNKYEVILEKVTNTERFPSDHRPIYLEVSL